MSTERHSCGETFDIGQFRFECSGHLYDPATLAEIATKYHDGLIRHTAQARPGVGDAEVSWWTEVAR